MPGQAAADVESQERRRARIFEAMAKEAGIASGELVGASDQWLAAAFCRHAGVKSVEVGKLKQRLVEYLNRGEAR